MAILKKMILKDIYVILHIFYSNRVSKLIKLPTFFHCTKLDMSAYVDLKNLTGHYVVNHTPCQYHLYNKTLNINFKKQNKIKTQCFQRRKITLFYYGKVIHKLCIIT